MSEAPSTSGADSTVPSAQKRWQFIDSSKDSSDNLTRVKRHVMQEYMRQKRQQAQRNDEPQGGQTVDRRSRRSARSQKNPNADESAVTTDKNRSKSRAKPQKTERDGDTHKQKTQAAVKQDESFGATSDADSDELEEVENILPVGFIDNDHPDSPHSSSSTKALPLPHRPVPYDNRSSGVFDSESIRDYDAVRQYVQIIGGPLARYPINRSDFNDFISWSSAQTSPEPQSSPRTILSAARTDPFETLPLQLDPEERKLFDFYVNEMPACSYGTHFRSTKAHNWYTAVFVPEAMKGAVCFQNTILVHAASTWEWVRNETETTRMLVHRGRALTMLREHLTKNPNDASDIAIIACLSAAALEDFDPRPGHKEISWMHMRAARQMIRNRGGPIAFENTRLAMLINWQDYILGGYETQGPSFYYENNPDFSAIFSKLWPEKLFASPSPTPSSHSALPHSPAYRPHTRSGTHASESKFPLSAQEEIRLQCEEFIDFLERAEKLAVGQANSREFSHVRLSCFQDGTLLYRILASPPGRRFTSSGNRKQMISRLAALMMLNAALWDYRFSARQTDHFQKNLAMKVLESEVDMSGSVEAVLQILLACEDNCIVKGNVPFPSPIALSTSQIYASPDFSQYSPTAMSPFARPWFVGRMLKVAKRLCLESWERVNYILFSSLTLQTQECVVSSWADELRREILEAPPTSYVMPILSSIPGT